MKHRFFALALIAAAAFAARPAEAAVTADVIFVVDESGSMAGEHAWLATMVSQLDTALNAASITGNRYGLVGFGNGQGGGNDLGRSIAVGGGFYGTAAQLATATGSLVTTGGFEDGYSGVNFALTNANYAFRSGAAVNIILITDEDRDNGNGALTYNAMLAALQADSAIFNVVVNANLLTAANAVALGVADDLLPPGSTGLTAYQANGSGGFTSSAGGSVPSAFGTTKADYIDLAWNTFGAAWDLNQLRAGGNTSQSFTKAFVDHKVAEILQSGPVPEPATCLIWAAGSLGLGLAAARRRRKLAA